jgi:hypothetical protein
VVLPKELWEIIKNEHDSTEKYAKLLGKFLRRRKHPAPVSQAVSA